MHDHEGGNGEVDDQTAGTGEALSYHEGRLYQLQTLQDQDELWDAHYGAKETFLI